MSDPIDGGHTVLIGACVGHAELITLRYPVSFERKHGGFHHRDSRRCGVAFGAAVQAVVAWLNNKATHEENSADMLHEAQTELKDTMADMNLLWEHNRALIDHIYRGAPPPPPNPPEGLFKHDN